MASRYNPLANLSQKDPIYKYCVNKGCSAKPALPLSKTSSGLNTSTNTTAISCRMKYAQKVNAYGTVQSSTSYPRKTCALGGPTFSY